MSNFCIIQDGSVVFGPMAWSPAAFSSELLSLGLGVSLTDVSPVAEITLGDGISIVPVTVIPPNATAFQTCGAANFAIGQGVVTVTYPLVDISLDDARTKQATAVVAACQGALSALVADYPALEISTWPQQYAEAVAFTASTSVATPMLTAIATAAGVTVATMAASIMVAATAFQAQSGGLIGKRQALMAKIAAATSVAGVQAATWL